MEKQVIIVAGGSGTRMGTDIPKQFISIGGKPILMWTIMLFEQYFKTNQLILALPESTFSLWEDLCKKHNFTISHKLIAGGETRFHSVYNALLHAGENKLLAIHDGVRPFAASNTISNLFKVAEQQGNAIPAVKIKDSVRITENDNNKPFPRNILRIIQTPQIFHSGIIKEAYTQNYEDSFTDDAAVIEKQGAKINLVEGNYENIKITTPSDILIAESLIKHFPF